MNAAGESPFPVKGHMVQRPDPQLVLLADSQLLFWSEEEGSLMQRVRRALRLANGHARAAYLGASNGDAPEFYEIFVAAMERIGIGDCRHVRVAHAPSDAAFVDAADLVLLAGGDDVEGLRALLRSGLADRVRAALERGAILVGVSAGAVQMGVLLSREDERGLALVRYAVGVHDEPEWSSLAASVERAAGQLTGLGLPLGGGALVYADRSVEPIRKPLYELSWTGERVRVAEVTAHPPAESSR
jgi:hypothetical protein